MSHLLTITWTEEDEQPGEGDVVRAVKVQGNLFLIEKAFWYTLQGLEQHSIGYTEVDPTP